MLKHYDGRRFIGTYNAAAFRRLCVETCVMYSSAVKPLTAAFRRLCVETAYWLETGKGEMPAAFRRLCVETIYPTCAANLSASRLQAAVC